MPRREHTQCCRVPGSLFRRSGSVWCCPVCHRLWVLIWEHGWGGDVYRTWEPVEQTVAKDGTASCADSSSLADVRRS